VISYGTARGVAPGEGLNYVRPNKFTKSNPISTCGAILGCSLLVHQRRSIATKLDTGYGASGWSTSPRSPMPIRRVGEGFIDIIVPSLSKMLRLAPEKLAVVEFFTALPAALHFQSLKLCLKWLGVTIMV
jgi:hypothetical protein